MSAVEIIAMIEKLPPAERAEVVAFVEKQKAGIGADGIRRAGVADGLAVGQGFMDRRPELFRKLAPAETGGARYRPQAEAERIAEQVFDKHHDLFQRLTQ